MQDKEFDQLFKDRFESAEIQPSADLWVNIAAELEPKKTKGFLVYWMSAAAVVLVTVGIALLTPKTEKIRLKAQVAENTSDASLDVIRPEIATKDPVSAADSNGKVTTSGTALVIAPRLRNADIKKDLIALQPQEPVVRLADKQPETFPAVNDDLPKVDEPVKDVVLASTGVTFENTISSITEAPQPEHRGIRNVGDIVNFVVNKVDRREHKIVQFDTDEDDNSSLVSLNLGIIKIGKRSNK